MIHLLQPRPTRDLISGGYRYNDEIARRLGSTGLGTLIELETHRLVDGPPVLPGGAEEATLVLDSLFLATQDPPAWLGAPKRSFATRLLLHYLPSTNPLFPAAERAQHEARERAWIGAVDAVITTSERLAEEVATRHECFVRAAIPGVSACFRPDAARGERDDSRAFTVVTVGGLIPEKGQLELTKILSECAGGGRTVRLVLIGDAEADAAYSAALRSASSTLDVELTGCLSPEAVAAHLTDADLFASASHFESYGMSVAEAAAMGVPVISYRVGEVERWIRDGENGFLFEPGDAEGMKAALQRLVALPEELSALRASSTKLFFPSWEYTFERFLTACRTDSRPDSPPSSRTREPVVFSSCDLPTAFGTFDVRVYRLEDGEEAILIHMGDLEAPAPPFVRVHSECFTGEILHSLKCDCKTQLDVALRTIAERGRGAVIYLRQEGRGIGLGNKIRAYAEQAKGANTVEANEMLGFPADLRDFRTAAAILRQAGVHRVHLNTNNPNKVTSLEANGIEVERVIPSTTDPNPHNLGYLLTKYRTLGHEGLQAALHGAGLIPESGRSGAAAVTSARGDAAHTLILMDLDGVIQVDDGVPGEAIELLSRLRHAGYAIRFLTNDGINSRASRLSQLRARGLEIELEELYTASYLTARYVAECNGGPILPLCGRPALDEFDGIARATTSARTVVVGDWFQHYDNDTVKAAYTALQRGAELVAMHKKRSWPTGGQRVIDIGFWVAGLEFCSGRAATVVGKPSEYSYATVLRDTGFAPEHVVMISDEVEPDLLGALRWGIRTVHFGRGEERAAAPIQGQRSAPTYGDVWEVLQAIAADG